MYNNINSLILSCIIVAGLIACDVTGEQNYDFEPGNSLNIVGADSINIPRMMVDVDTTIAGNDTTFDTTRTEVPATESYYVQAFTIEKDYSWNVEGGASSSVYRSGEFIDLTFEEGGIYTLSVDDGEYQGTLEIEVVDTTS